MKRLIIQKLSTLVFLFVLITFSASFPKSIPANAPPQSVKLAILMYHGFTKDGNESTYVISESEFEKDIIYLKENGFTFVMPGDISDFVSYGNIPGEKCVMITFDDGYLNNYAFAYPILKKYGAKAVISPIAALSDYQSVHPDGHTEYAHITWEQVSEMSQSGLVEFQNHSYNLHSFSDKRKGSAKNHNESSGEYRKMFFEDLKKAHDTIKLATNKAPYVYVYPFGQKSPEMTSVLKCLGYKMSFGCESGYNILTGNQNEMWNMKRFNRSNITDASKLLKDY
ncbi:MAG: polysaccharide deacetylase family protein [Clostridia bacterium]|nr:polysaccharide deacetylase family protein [Clostridia bacterium]